MVAACEALYLGPTLAARGRARPPLGRGLNGPSRPRRRATATKHGVNTPHGFDESVAYHGLYGLDAGLLAAIVSPHTTRRTNVPSSTFRRSTLRFRIDGEDQPCPSGPPHGRSRAGVLDDRLRIEFLRLLHDGLGRVTACARIGIGVGALGDALAESPSFRRAVEQIERVRAEKLYSTLYDAALRGDTRAALFLLARHDREMERRAGRTDDAQ
jgi:hypothetical protein